MTIIAAVSARPMSAQPNMCSVRSGASGVLGISFSVMNQNAIAEMRPDTITPL
jgi:hypothetical protein